MGEIADMLIEQALAGDDLSWEWEDYEPRPLPPGIARPELKTAKPADFPLVSNE